MDMNTILWVVLMFLYWLVALIFGIMLTTDSPSARASIKEHGMKSESNLVSCIVFLWPIFLPIMPMIVGGVRIYDMGYDMIEKGESVPK